MKKVFTELGMESDTLDEDCDILLKLLEPKESGRLNFQEFVAAFMAR